MIKVFKKQMHIWIISMNFLLNLFILCNVFFSQTQGFQNNLPLIKTHRIIQNNNVCMSESRRDVLKLPLKTLGTYGTLGSASILSQLLPQKAFADTENDGSWTQHNGKFSENDLGEYTKTSTGLLYKDVEVGKGPVPNEGDAVTIQMVGYIFETGEKWCNTYKGIPAFQSVVRAGARENQKFMKGLNEGVQTMHKGGKRILVIPAYLAYSYTTIFSDKNPDVPIIPGGSNLVCYVEVLDFRKLN